jgi:hypothetical protein
MSAVATPARPVALAPKFGDIPIVLQVIPHWVLWKYEDRNAKWTKVPYTPGGTAASTKDPATWSPFDSAVAAYSRGGFDGVGFVLDETNAIAAIDLDHVLVDGRLHPEAQAIIDAIGSYTEVSPSGNGVRILAIGKLPSAAWRKAAKYIVPIEMYDSARYVTITGHRLLDAEIESREAEITALHARVAAVIGGTNPNGYPKTESALVREHQGAALTDDQVIQKMLAASNGAAVLRLWEGNTSDHNDDDSAADLALCSHLAFWTGGDEEQMDRLFRRSGLMREKWDSPRPGGTYGMMTIAKAIKDRAVYRGPIADCNGSEEAKDEKPIIDTRGRDWETIHEDGYKSIAAPNASTIYQMGDILVRVRIDDDERPKIQPMTDAALRAELTRRALWIGGDGRNAKPIVPPTATVEYIQTRPTWPDILPLRRIVEAPFFTKEGELSTVPGYQARSRIWFYDADGMCVPNVSDQPSTEEIARAKSLLLDQLLVDFPFDGPASRVHAMAMMLVPVLREMIEGVVPAHGIVAPTPGSGKGLLQRCSSIIATGSAPYLVTPPTEEAEWRKLITAQLLDAPTLINFDNVGAKLDSSALAAALTMDYHKDRILGVSKTVTLPNRALWVFTGNNVRTSREIADRFVWIKLLPNCERPRDRRPEEFRHHPLDGWVKKHRGELVWALLTLGRAWVAAGRPPYSGSRTKGSFEQWLAVTGGVLEVAGMGGDFLGNDQAMFDETEDELAPWRPFIVAWMATYPNREVTVGELEALAAEEKLLEDVLPPASGFLAETRARQTALGRQLQRLRDQVIGVWRPKMRTGRKTLWRLEPVRR